MKEKLISLKSVETRDNKGFQAKTKPEVKPEVKPKNGVETTVQNIGKALVFNKINT